MLTASANIPNEPTQLQKKSVIAERSKATMMKNSNKVLQSQARATVKTWERQCLQKGGHPAVRAGDGDALLACSLAIVRREQHTRHRQVLHPVRVGHRRACDRRALRWARRRARAVAGRVGERQQRGVCGKRGARQLRRAAVLVVACVRAGAAGRAPEGGARGAGAPFVEVEGLRREALRMGQAGRRPDGATDGKRAGGDGGR